MVRMMIVSFSVANFRSFLGEETLSLVASKRFAGNLESHLVPIPGMDDFVLRTAVVYGANGAGKSNLFKALDYLKDFALETRKSDQGTGRVPFRFTKKNSRPTSFDLHFIANQQLYRFGLKVDDNYVLEEWLVRVVGKRETPLYEKVTDKHGKVRVETKGLEGHGKKMLANPKMMKALATIGGPPNQTFLATIGAMLDHDSYGEELKGIFEWFGQKLTLIAPDAPFIPLGHYLDDDSDFLEFASEFLKSSSTGVEHLEIEKKEITEEQLDNVVPQSLLSNIVNNVGDDNIGILRSEDGKNIIVKLIKGKKQYFSIDIKANHKNKTGKNIYLDLKEESDGTRRLLDLIPALYRLRNKGGIFVIDEIDRSMHPILTKKFLDFFLRCCANEQRQIIITTHESNLLDLELLRRDEIWFTEKDNNGATRLYSLGEFKVRKDLEIRKHYLQGRFGAVPFLGSIDHLLEKEISE